MSEQLIFENYLLVLKSTVEVYVHGTLESSNESVRILLKEGLNNTLSMQSNIFNLMNSNGWYQVNNISSELIVNSLKKIDK